MEVELRAITVTLVGGGGTTSRGGGGGGRERERTNRVGGMNRSVGG